MLNNNHIIVFDTETTGLNAGVNEIIEIAAVAIDPRTLEIIDDSEFYSLVKPLKPENAQEAALKVNNKNLDDLLENGSHPQEVWANFQAYLKRYNVGKGFMAPPIPCGHNLKFDLGFIEHCWARPYGGWGKNEKLNCFNTMTIDTMDLIWLWFENSNELPNKKLDTFRDYTGYSKDGAHEAMADVTFTADILIKFLKLHRAFYPKVKFANAYVPKGV